MSTTVLDIFKNAGERYNARLAAGKDGLSNIVKWVHIVEYPDVAFFLHGAEIVFTAGIMNKYKGWVLQFAKDIHQAGAAAFVVNLGVYIPEIPQDVIEYCDKVGLPLYTIPWKTRMVDMTRDFCNHIVREEQRDESVSSLVKDMVFGSPHPEETKSALERHGYRSNYAYHFLAISYSCSKEEEAYTKVDGEVSLLAEHRTRTFHDLPVHFHYREKLFFLLVGYSDRELRALTESLAADVSYKKKKPAAYFAVGPSFTGLSESRQPFEQTFTLSCQGKKSGQPVIFFDDLTIGRLLVSIPDSAILQGYVQKALGPLQEYDQTRGTGLTDFLECYLRNNCSPQKVSEELFVHRNTVSNYIHKVSDLLGVNLEEQKTRTMLYLAFEIKKML
ncbi:MAG: PucR family transcriptional regulator [Eubacterium sp.]|nr:PucR family transcriptional regulator [Eubacterium sp.]